MIHRLATRLVVRAGLAGNYCEPEFNRFRGRFLQNALAACFGKTFLEIVKQDTGSAGRVTRMRSTP
jgi:hypothetical protein